MVPNNDAESPVYDCTTDWMDGMDGMGGMDGMDGIDRGSDWASPFAGSVVSVSCSGFPPARRRALAARADLAKSGYVMTVATHPPKAPATACTTAGSEDVDAMIA